MALKAHIADTRDRRKCFRIGLFEPPCGIGFRAFSVPASFAFKGAAVKKIGIIFGMESTFPPALVDKINSFNDPDVQAELAIIGEVRMAEPSPYHVIIDRISHDIPFYRGYLKNAALSGSIIINNPFWWSADDKFFNFALGTKLGVAIPKTVLLPHKHHPPGTTERSMRNLEYPLPWDSIFDYVGFPAFLKPFDGGGWKDVYKVTSPGEFLPCLRPNPRSLHDAADGGELQRVFSLLLCRPAEGSHHAVRPFAAFSRALCEEPGAGRPQASGAGRAGLPDAVPRPGLRPEHRGICLRRRDPLRD